jgi:hypothetical protein
MKKIITIIISIILAVLVIGGLVIFFNIYPMAMVGWQPITAGTFKKDLTVATFFYKTTLGETADINSPEIEKKIKQEVLDKLIEDILIDREINKQLKNSELEEIISNKTKELLKVGGIEGEINLLYGLPLDKFKEQVLRPLLKREILANRMFLNNKNLNNWLSETKKQTKVMIFLPDLVWKDGKVQIK